jgi:hypothetical protein
MVGRYVRDKPIALTASVIKTWDLSGYECLSFSLTPQFIEVAQ